MLYCIIGKSGSGKTTTMNYLRKYENDTQAKVLCEYTTRPPRTGEIDGETYHFCTQEQFEQMRGAGEVLEWRKYDTVHGTWYYFNRKAVLSNEQNYVVATTPDAALSFIAAYGKDNVGIVYLDADSWIRLKRCIERDENGPDYKEIFRRFLSDEEEFCDTHPIWQHPHFWAVWNEEYGDKHGWLFEIKDILEGVTQK